MLDCKLGVEVIMAKIQKSADRQHSNVHDESLASCAWEWFIAASTPAGLLLVDSIINDGMQVRRLRASDPSTPPTLACSRITSLIIGRLHPQFPAQQTWHT